MTWRQLAAKIHQMPNRCKDEEAIWVEAYDEFAIIAIDDLTTNEAKEPIVDENGKEVPPGTYYLY